MLILIEQYYGYNLMNDRIEKKRKKKSVCKIVPEVTLFRCKHKCCSGAQAVAEKKATDDPEWSELQMVTCYPLL